MSAHNGSTHHPAESSAFVRAMEPVARELLGEPSETHRGKRELRWGTRGSLSVSLDKGTWHDHETGQGGGVLDLVRDRAGLDKPAAIAWLQHRGHLPQEAPAKPTGRREAAAYRYTDAAGGLLFEVVRFEPKDFRQRQPDGRGGWAWNMAGVPLVPYRLPELLAAVQAGRTVFVAEGEKGADALGRLGLTGTCSPGGAGKWRGEYVAHLVGARVVVLSDNDEPGRAHAATVAASLRGTAGRVQVLHLPDLPPKGDVADWIEAGGTADELERLARAEPETPLGLLWYDRIMPVVDAKDFVQGVLVEGGAAVVYGDSNTGKTFWVTDLALHVATGTAWNGRRVDQGGVIYCALEGGNGFRNRVAAWRRANPRPDGTTPFAAIPASLNLLDPDEDTPRLIATVQAAADQMGQPVKLIVVDTLSRAMAGGNENAPDDMGALVRSMDAIRAATGACVLFIHHSGKDAAKGARGHSLLRAAMDTEIEIRADEATGSRTASVVKQRELTKGAAFGFRLDVQILGRNQHGEDVTSCTVAPEAADEQPRHFGTKLSTEEQGWLRDIQNLFADSRESLQQVQPDPDMPPVTGVTRERLRTWLQHRGRVGVTPCVTPGVTGVTPLTSTERMRLMRYLNRLKDKGKIGILGEWVWLT